MINPRFVFKFAAIVLAITSFSKVVAVVAESRALAAPSPLFNLLSNRQHLATAAFMEFGVVFVLLAERTRLQKSAALAWLTTTFIVYRFALVWLGFIGSCSCAGAIEWLFPLKEKQVDMVMMFILVVLWVGSVTTLIQSLWEMRVTTVDPAESGGGGGARADSQANPN
jgi:hypothetical protein